MKPTMECCFHPFKEWFVDLAMDAAANQDQLIRKATFLQKELATRPLKGVGENEMLLVPRGGAAVLHCCAGIDVGFACMGTECFRAGLITPDRLVCGPVEEEARHV